MCLSCGLHRTRPATVRHCQPWADRSCTRRRGALNACFRSVPLPARRWLVLAVSAALLAGLLPGISVRPVRARHVGLHQRDPLRQHRHRRRRADRGRRPGRHRSERHRASSSTTAPNGRFRLRHGRDLGVLPSSTTSRAASATAVFSYPVERLAERRTRRHRAGHPADVVVQFLSYEGIFTATGRPCQRHDEHRHRVSQRLATEPLGQSLQLTGNGTSYEDFAWVRADGRHAGRARTRARHSATSRTEPVVADLRSRR